MRKRVVAAVVAAVALSSTTVQVTQAAEAPVAIPPLAGVPAARLAAIDFGGHDALPVQQMGELYEDLYGPFTNDLPPAGQTPEQRAQWLLEDRPAAGKTPTAWIDGAKRSLATVSATTVPTRPASLVTPDLTTEVLGLYALVGLDPTRADRTAIARSAAALPADVRTAFAKVVATTRLAYAAQLPLATTIGARFEAGFDPKNPLMTQAERDLTNARQQAILSAIAEFRVVGLPALDRAGARSSSEPTFADPEGLVVLGGSGNDEYVRGGAVADPVLLIDPSGDDTYRNSAGGACPVTPDAFFGTWLECNGIAVSVVADLGVTPEGAVNDQYLYDGPPSAIQGAGGPGGIGVLVDVSGDDVYDVKMTRGETPPFVPITYYFDGGAQGFGYAGNGLLVDQTGYDHYTFEVGSTHGHSIWELGQGFGGAGGTGTLVDGDGNDYYTALGYGLTGQHGFEGIYTQGVGFYGGVGVVADLGADKDWWKADLKAETVDFYAQGFAAFTGAGIMYEDGGDDWYSAVEEGTDPWIRPLLNCAFGTASYAGTGILLEVAGNDDFFGKSISPYSSFVMDWGWGGPGQAYGLYVDLGGDDIYELEGVGNPARIEGWGLFTDLGNNVLGTFVDIGGNDTYIGNKPVIGNDKLWNFGIDRA